MYMYTCDVSMLNVYVYGIQILETNGVGCPTRNLNLFGS